MTDRGYGCGVFAFALPPTLQPRHEDHLALVDLTEEVPEEEVGSPFLAVEEVERPTSPVALAIFGLGLLVAVSLALRAPGLAGLAFVGGVVGGGILNAPTGMERLRTAAALGVPTVALGIITYAFVSSL
ncbi:hypothetical protein [Actinomarinicola tropica]|uniref:Uncharacterized protein n=1 Tax=Actinomarinicola tropica TaxID=2789776 RepID=A0A5Q2RMJ7_9ACTN|nr:hypothetical protein [Actinomarinicola tropica]QGG95781.1 hypothetical protein GH723_12115 [Actinomarinicola tropica]